MEKLKDENSCLEQCDIEQSLSTEDCGCSTDSCCGDGASDSKKDTHQKGSIKIDGLKVDFEPEDKNLVDVADRGGIGIPAPCYRNNRKKGCCNACVVEIDGEQKFACATKPEDGMSIVVNREDLNQLRKERLEAYANGIKNNILSECSCQSDTSCC